MWKDHLEIVGLVEMAQFMSLLFCLPVQIAMLERELIYDNTDKKEVKKITFYMEMCSNYRFPETVL